jgi:hypothetical protein
LNAILLIVKVRPAIPTATQAPENAPDVTMIDAATQFAIVAPIVRPAVEYRSIKYQTRPEPNEFVTKKTFSKTATSA